MEYGLLIAGIAALIVVVVFAFGEILSDIFNDTCDSVERRRGRLRHAPDGQHLTTWFGGADGGCAIHRSRHLRLWT